jgi:hypothetical protein
MRGRRHPFQGRLQPAPPIAGFLAHTLETLPNASGQTRQYVKHLLGILLVLDVVGEIVHDPVEPLVVVDRRLLGPTERPKALLHERAQGSPKARHRAAWYVISLRPSSSNVAPPGLRAHRRARTSPTRASTVSLSFSLPRVLARWTRAAMDSGPARRGVGS